MDVYFQITKSSKNSQTKNLVFIILLPNFLLFLGTTPLFHSHFFSDKPCTTHTICFSYTRPSLVIAQSAVNAGAKVADMMFPPRHFCLKTQLHHFCEHLITHHSLLWKNTRTQMLYNLSYHTTNVNSLVRNASVGNNLTIPIIDYLLKTNCIEILSDTRMNEQKTRKIKSILCKSSQIGVEKERFYSTSQDNTRVGGVSIWLGVW